MTFAWDSFYFAFPWLFSAVFAFFLGSLQKFSLGSRASFLAACVCHELLIFMCDTINHQSLSMNFVAWLMPTPQPAYPSIFAFLSADWRTSTNFTRFPLFFACQIGASFVCGFCLEIFVAVVLCEGFI